MSEVDPPAAEAPARGRFDGPAGLAMVVIAAVAGAALLERFSRPTDGGPFGPMPLPTLLAQGWLNTSTGGPPARDSLSGKYVVIDSWATDCGPCVRALPDLAEFYQRWRSRGVEVIALTGEPVSRLDTIRGLIDRIDGMQWPIGYGAGMMNAQLGVSMLPTYTLFGPDGTSVWRGASLPALEEEIVSRLGNR